MKFARVMFLVKTLTNKDVSCLAVSDDTPSKKWGVRLAYKTPLPLRGYEKKKKAKTEVAIRIER